MDKYQIVWNLTSKCNEGCKFCFRKKCKDISLDENKRIVDKIADLNIEALSFSGGEALLYDGIFELVQYVKFKMSNTKIILNTNGKHIDKSTLEKIVDNFDAITLPIDSSDYNFNINIGRGNIENNKLEEIGNLLNNYNLNI